MSFNNLTRKTLLMVCFSLFSLLVLCLHERNVVLVATNRRRFHLEVTKYSNAILRRKI